MDPAVLEAEIRGKLATEQKQVLDLVLAGHNVFLTGSFVSASIFPLTSCQVLGCCPELSYSTCRCHGSSRTYPKNTQTPILCAK